MLSLEDAETFKYAISQHYWYQLYLDDLPVWGMVGEIVGSEEELAEMEAEEHGGHEHETHDAFIYTTKRFSVAYNGRQIIEVNLTAEDPVPATAGQKLELTYAVSWHETTHSFDRRFDRQVAALFAMGGRCALVTFASDPPEAPGPGHTAPTFTPPRLCPLCADTWTTASLSIRFTGSPSSTPS